MMLSPLPLIMSALALTGMGLSLASGGMLQPDWALAILLAWLLAHRKAWPWALPLLLLHDLTLYWSPWGEFPLACLLPLLLMAIDDQIGPGLPQRIMMLLLVSAPALIWHAGIMQWLLTLMVCIVVWHMLARVYEHQPA